MQSNRGVRRDEIMPRGDGFAKPRQKRAAYSRTVNPRYPGANSHERRSLAVPPSNPSSNRSLVVNGSTGTLSQYCARGT